jgi:hypothetical protein
MQELCTKVQPTNVLLQDELLSLFTYAAAPENAKPKTAFSAREREGGSSKLIVEEFKWSQTLSNSARVICDVCSFCVRFLGALLVSCHLHFELCCV